MSAYYNENDPHAATWLRELINAGLIAQGDVDERSIEDVRPDELTGYTQCHFFAGIGGWSYALRLAGWPDDNPVWTGSCPCQPFSAAGKGDGFTDERHLWPAWFWLIEQCRPGVVFGEQVEAAIRHGWLDLVQADLEAIGYAVGAVGLPAASIGAPHIRQRLWFVAESLRTTSERGTGGVLGTQAQISGARIKNGNLTDRFANGSQDCAGDLANTESERLREARTSSGRSAQWIGDGGEQSGMEHAAREQVGIPGRARESGSADSELDNTANTRHNCTREHGSGSPLLAARPVESGVASFWREADWLPCIDGKARPVESGTFPLAHGIPARVVRLRGYGNAIVPQVAAEIIRAYIDQ